MARLAGEDLYRRAHNALLSEIEAVVPIDAVKSIDELTCSVEPGDQADPSPLGHRIKQRLRDNIGPYITCSIGFAANRQLAKMACKAGKRVGAGYGDGLTIWHPSDMPAPLLAVALADVPGIGTRMAARLALAGVATMAALLAMQPRQMRQIWGSVTGERLWYALHGYDVQTPASGRGMYGHSRVLPPDHRSMEDARAASRLLIVKAARRMRRDGWDAGALWLWLGLWGSSWSGARHLPAVHDDQAILLALAGLWTEASLSPASRIARVGVTLLDLTPMAER